MVFCSMHQILFFSEYQFPDYTKYFVHQDCIEGSKALLSGPKIRPIHPTNYNINKDSFDFLGTFTYNRLCAKYYPTGVKKL